MNDSPNAGRPRRPRSGGGRRSRSRRHGHGDQNGPSASPSSNPSGQPQHSERPERKGGENSPLGRDSASSSSSPSQSRRGRRRRGRRGGPPGGSREQQRPERRESPAPARVPRTVIATLPETNGHPVLVDSHAHLADAAFDEDRREVVERAIAEGVHYIMAMGSSLETSRQVVDLSISYAGVYAAVGIHPHDVKGLDNKVLSEIAELAGQPKVVAIGEIGLDYYRNNSPQKTQRHWFREQVRLAVKLGKPIVVHCREAGEDVYSILEEEKVWRVGGVVHCFTGDWELAKRLLDLDLHLGAAGPLTFAASEELREVFERVPVERVFVETDSPYLAPPPHRGKRNEPAYVVRVAETLAELHGMTAEQVTRITSLNTLRLFGVGPERRPGTIAYPYRRGLYLNITNRCSNACFFCGLLSDRVFKGYDLSLEQEPDAAAILEAAGDPSLYDEVVFSGFGEPTQRLDVLKEVAGTLRQRGARRIRLVTNGLGSRTNGREIVPELSGLFDAVSVSLQAESAEAYQKVCKTEGIENPYPSVKDFVRAAKRYFDDVEATAVDMPGVIRIAEVEKVAREELDVPFRAHAYIHTD